MNYWDNSSASLNNKIGDCDFNAGLIDLYYRQTYQEREKHQKKTRNTKK